MTENGEGECIPPDMPQPFLDSIGKKVKHVEGIGEPIAATFLVDSKVDPTNWYIHPSFFFLFSFLFCLYLFLVLFSLKVSKNI